MELIAITAHRLAFCSLVAITIISLSLPAPALAAKLSGQEATVVTELEQCLFFNNYPDEGGEQRVARIEKQVYGEVLQAPWADRIARLKQMLEEKKSAEAVRQEEQQRRQQQQVKNQLPPQQRNDFDRARENIIAAREQEIQQLLADGVDLWRQKRAQEAAQRFEQVLRLDSNNAEAHFSLGIIEESTGNLVEALSSYQQAATSQPQVREYAEAAKTVEKKLATKQVAMGQQQALRMLAEAASAAFKQQDYVRALDLYKTLDSKSPNQALVKYNIGTLYLMLKDQNNALKFYQQAVKLNPAEPRYLKAYSELKGQVEILNAAIEENNRQSAQLRGGKPPKPGKKQKVYQQKTPDQIPPFPMGRAKFGGGNAVPTAMQQSPQSQVFGGYLNTPAADLMSKYGLSGKGTNNGVKVTTVGVASRAAAAGIQPGDSIRAVDGNEVYDVKTVNEILTRKGFNERVQLLLMRNGQMGVIQM
jgi:tetratricopeptide (TPR) repeat protein